MNRHQRSAALQLFAIAYMIACIVGMVLQAKWGLVMAIAIAAFLGLCVAGAILWAIWTMVVQLITGEEQ